MHGDATWKRFGAASPEWPRLAKRCLGKSRNNYLLMVIHHPSALLNQHIVRFFFFGVNMLTLESVSFTVLMNIEIVDRRDIMTLPAVWVGS